MTESPASPSPAFHARRLVLVALMACLVTWTIAAVYPSGRPADELMSLSFGATYGWILFQSLVLILPGLVMGCLMGRFLPRSGTLLGTSLMLSVPQPYLYDLVAEATRSEDARIRENAKELVIRINRFRRPTK